MIYRALIMISLIFATNSVTSPVQAEENVADMPATAESVAHELALAEAARQKASEARAEWLQTASLIEQARKAADAGDWQQAQVLARQARQQGDLAVKQAERESVAWRERVVR